MRIHEYQAKRFLSLLGAPVPRGQIAYTPGEAVEVLASVGGPSWIVKAQICAGGRGKAGGIHICDSADEVFSVATALLGSTLFTPQTPPQGLNVRKIYIERVHKPEQEFYLSMSLDRSKEAFLFLVSKCGGVEIEKHKDSFLKLTVDPVMGIHPFHCRRIFEFLNLPSLLYAEFETLLRSIYKAYTLYDATLIEINPLGVSGGSLVVLDAKMTFDENALDRHPDISSILDFDHLTPLEEKAQKDDLNYVKLSGNIGCLVNGAGLAMATMDLIHYLGGAPANFLDAGGAADETKIKTAFELLVLDPTVDVIFANIFGGILRCDAVSQGLLTLSRMQPVAMPIVMRFQGTRSQEARELLRYTSLDVTFIDDLEEAARKAVFLAQPRP